MSEGDHNTPVKIAFLQGRPSGHPFNRKLAAALHADFYFTDHKLRYTDIESSAIRRYLSWVLTALFFPRKKYSIIFTESLRFPILTMRMFGVLGRRRKAIALICDETLYFLYTGYYRPSTQKAFIKLLEAYDGFICVGDQQRELLKKVCPVNKPAVAFYCGTPTDRLEKLAAVRPALDTQNILVIANGPGGFRTWYKGLDLMLMAFYKAKRSFPKLTFTVVGDWSEETIDHLIHEYCPDCKDSVFFPGQTQHIEHHLAKSALYLHCARGEGWGISVNEAMAAGLPAIVSEWTGAKELVEKASSDLVVPLDENAIVRKIEWYFSLEPQKREILSKKCRETVTLYDEERAILAFKDKFSELIKALDVT